MACRPTGSTDPGPIALVDRHEARTYGLIPAKQYSRARPRYHATRRFSRSFSQTAREANVLDLFHGSIDFPGANLYKVPTKQTGFRELNIGDSV